MTTNREKLANMTNEELAIFLNKDVCLYCAFSSPINNCGGNRCIEGTIQWLNSQSDGE